MPHRTGVKALKLKATYQGCLRVFEMHMYKYMNANFSDFIFRVIELLTVLDNTGMQYQVFFICCISLLPGTQFNKSSFSFQYAYMN